MRPLEEPVRFTIPNYGEKSTSGLVSSASDRRLPSIHELIGDLQLPYDFGCPSARSSVSSYTENGPLTPPPVSRSSPPSPECHGLPWSECYTLSTGCPSWQATASGAFTAEEQYSEGPHGERWSISSSYFRPCVAGYTRRHTNPELVSKPRRRGHRRQPYDIAERYGRGSRTRASFPNTYHDDYDAVSDSDSNSRASSVSAVVESEPPSVSSSFSSIDVDPTPGSTKRNNTPYSFLEAIFIIYHMTDMNLTWNETSRRYNMFFTDRPRRSVGGLRCEYYRMNSRIPVIDENGLLDLGPFSPAEEGDKKQISDHPYPVEGGVRYRVREELCRSKRVTLAERFPEEIVYGRHSWVLPAHRDDKELKMIGELTFPILQ
jgi:hypothetical protein